MTLQEAIKILDNHNKWRRGNDTIQMTDPTELGIAIELVINELRNSNGGCTPENCRHGY